MTENNVKYDMRAPPRRRIKGEDPDDQPVFLRKAFVMMSSCPADIGGWSEKGDTVVIKDAKLFAEKIIPTAYKHNNFSSFVRQLNFYGFRKIKSEAAEHALWWEFRHPHFLRDQPQLICEIKRSVHYVSDSPNVHEVSDLKSQVGSLTDRIEALHEQIEMLTGAVSHIQLTAGHGSEESGRYATDVAGLTDSSKKKRKLVSKRQGGVVIKTEPDMSPVVTDSGPYLMRMSSIDSQLDLVGDDMTLPTGPELQSLGLFRNNSLTSGAGPFAFDSSESDENWFADMDRLLAVVDEPESPVKMSSYGSQQVKSSSSSHEEYTYFKRDGTGVSSSAAASKEAYFVQDQLLPQASVVPATTGGVQDLFAILESLSPELKVRFVDKLAEVMGKQLANNMGTSTAETAPVTAAPVYTAEAPRRDVSPTQNFAHLTTGASAPYHLPSGVPAPEIALPLASAALGAFVISSLNTLVLNQEMETAHSMSRKAMMV